MNNQTLKTPESILQNAPEGLIKFTALTKPILNKLELNENEKEKIIKLMCQEICDIKQYSKISSKISPSELRTISYQAVSDYTRCLLSKALSTTFNKIAPKYRNVAARRVFLKRFSELSKAIHISKSQLSLRQLFGETLKDEENSILQYFHYLTTEKTFPEEELGKKKKQAEQELKIFIKKMENIIGLKWENTEKYIPQLKIVSFFDPWHFDDENPTHWGVKYYPTLNTLNLQPPFLFFDSLRRGILAREAAYLFMPKIIDRIPEIREQHNYLSYKLLDNTFDRGLWFYSRHGKHKSEEGSTNEVFEWLIWYENTVGETLFKELYSRLKKISEFSTLFTSISDYYMVLDSIAAKPVTTLFDPDELNLLKKLVKNPLDTISQLSKKIGLTIETTQKIFNKLIRKSNLWFGAFVDVKKIGLTEYCIFLETRNAALVRKIFQNFPYCTIIYRVYGPTDLFIIVDLPNENKEFLVKVLKEFQDLGVINRFFISEPIKHYYNINFDYYDEQQGKWCIYWDEWSLFLREQLQKKLQVDISEESKLIKRSIKFDQLDIQIINLLLSNSRISYSEVGRLTNISGTYARKKVKNLLDNEVLSPGMGSYKIGLNDVTHVLIDCNLHIAATLAIAFNKLPSWRGALLKGDINGIVGMLFIPNGEIESFFKTLDENLIRPSLVNRCLFHTTGPWTSWRRGLPELYFEGKWIFDERKFIEDFRAALRR